MRWPAIVAALIVLTAASPSGAAATYNYTASLKYDTLVAGKVVALSIAWDCAGKVCTTSGPWPVPGVGACAALAEKVGEIVAYGYAKIQLSANQLAQCNANAAKQPPAKTLLLKPQTNLAAPKKALPIIPPLQKTPSAPAKPGAQGGEPAGEPANGAFTPKTVRTETLTVTGTGALAPLPPFTPVNLRTKTLTVTGTGSLAALPPFTPVNIRTTPLTVTGTGGE
ncbi:MAG TPA: hypothetical protein VNH64_08675 [Parvularculaceae bacterium]|nr:hypothetical protein [Parvularculaceae bacterium]